MFQRSKLQSFEFTVNGAAIAGLAVAVLFGYGVLLRPAATERIAGQTRIASQQDLVHRALELTEQKRTVDAELTAAKAKLESLLQRIPAAPNESDFLASISALADQAGMNVADYRPGAIETRPSHRELEVKINASGEYSAVCRFLAGLKQLPRLSRLMQLDLAADAEGDVLTAELTFRIYFARPADAASEKKG